jgi:photosystem II stability/assembly factor-like uncharacterized protein
LTFLSVFELYGQQGWYWQNPLPQGNFLRSVQFIDQNAGYAVGDGSILKTTNGGANWILQARDTPTSLFSVSFVNANTGTAVGIYGAILHTTDGGTNWLPQTSGTEYSLRGVSFAVIDTGIAVGENGIILHTTNGGTNWTTQISGTMKILRGVYFVNAKTGTAVGDSGTILHNKRRDKLDTANERDNKRPYKCVLFGYQ